MLGKIVAKSEKKRFLYSHEYRDQEIGRKKARNNFSRNTQMVRAKMLRKKSSQKRAKKRFLYSHEFRDEKIGGKNARNNFSRNTRMVKEKCWEKNRRKNVR